MKNEKTISPRLHRTATDKTANLFPPDINALTTLSPSETPSENLNISTRDKRSRSHPDQDKNLRWQRYVYRVMILLFQRSLPVSASKSWGSERYFRLLRVLIVAITATVSFSANPFSFLSFDKA